MRARQSCRSSMEYAIRIYIEREIRLTHFSSAVLGLCNVGELSVNHF